MSQPDIQIEVFGKTDVGLIREHNEDNLLWADLTAKARLSTPAEPTRFDLGPNGALFLVCDGMGGAAAGEVASQMAVDAIYETMASREPRDRDAFARGLRQAVEIGNDRIFQQSRDNQNERGMGTTCTAAAMVDETLVIAQIGDSRCYVLRDKKLAQVTKDQSLAWQLIEAGAMTPEDAKAFEHANIILQALGVQERVEVVMSRVALRRGDVILLCSDGLHGPVSDEEIVSILNAEADLKKAAEALLQRALEHDGPDNITCVLARVGGAGLPEPTAEDRVSFVPYDPGRDPLPESLTRKAGGATASSPDHPADLTRTESQRPAKPEAGGGGDESSRVADAADAAEDRTPAQPSARGKGGRGAAARQSRVVEDEDDDDYEVPRPARSVIALFFLALLAAAAGGIFVLKCERSQATRTEGAAQAP